jgi:hypothetical protein
VKNFFNQALNIHGFQNVKQVYIHKAEPLVPEPSLVEVEIAIGKLKSYKSVGSDQILAKLIKAGGENLCSEIHKLICSTQNKEELPQQWKECIVIPIHIKDGKTCNNYRGSPFYQVPTKFYATFFWPGYLHTSMKLLVSSVWVPS